MSDCVFCQRIDNYDYEQSYNQFVVRFEPLNPVTPGHMLFVPTEHCEHRTSLGTEEVRAAMSYAHTYARHEDVDFNLITSSGSAATQSIDHIHIHYVPRRPGDGLHLPWTGQQTKSVGITDKGRAVIESGLTVRQAHELERGCSSANLCANCQSIEENQ